MRVSEGERNEDIQTAIHFGCLGGGVCLCLLFVCNKWQKEIRFILFTNSIEHKMDAFYCWY